MQAVRGSVVIVAEDRVFKTAWAGGAMLVADYRRYRAAIDTWPALAEVLAATHLERAGGLPVLSMHKLLPVSLQLAEERAPSLFELLRTCRGGNGAEFDIRKSAEIRSGLGEITRLFGAGSSRILESFVERLHMSANYTTGFVHGDFHSRNIMIDTVGRYRLIDLDCIRLQGIQELDALHFILESEWSRAGSMWYEQLVDIVDGRMSDYFQNGLRQFAVTVTNELAAVYLLDRIGQDFAKYGFEYLPRDLEKVVGRLTG